MGKKIKLTNRKLKKSKLLAWNAMQQQLSVLLHQCMISGGDCRSIACQITGSCKQLGQTINQPTSLPGLPVNGGQTGQP